MATNVVVLGGQEGKKELKKIEFVKWLATDFQFDSTAPSRPDEWKNIELICKNYSDIFDLMFAYDKERTCGVLYVGHFNDGVV